MEWQRFVLLLLVLVFMGGTQAAEYTTCIEPGTEYPKSCEELNTMVICKEIETGRQTPWIRSKEVHVFDFEDFDLRMNHTFKTLQRQSEELMESLRQINLMLTRMPSCTPHLYKPSTLFLWVVAIGEWIADWIDVVGSWMIHLAEWLVDPDLDTFLRFINIAVPIFYLLGLCTSVCSYLRYQQLNAQARLLAIQASGASV